MSLSLDTGMIATYLVPDLAYSSGDSNRLCAKPAESALRVTHTVSRTVSNAHRRDKHSQWSKCMSSHIASIYLTMLNVTSGPTDTGFLSLGDNSP
ncbi:hypothetical protein GB937_010229 [Aspergillus fischeri]|nr:hypothetical protein GB937_010229 [Aspergillus fischeri]